MIKGLIGTLVFMAALAVSAFAEADPAQKALDDARRYAQAGEYAKALERHEWYHENALASGSGQYGVRLSFALSAWIALGDQYPPALASLKGVRDANIATLEGGGGDIHLFHDVVSINQELGDDALTVKVFQQLHEKRPAFAKEAFRMGDKVLLKEGAIDLFGAYAQDLPAYLQLQISQHGEFTSDLKRRNADRYANVIKGFDEELVSNALQLISISEKEGDAATAEKLREMAFAVVPDPRLKPKE